jgi:hypothetical protein
MSRRDTFVAGHRGSEAPAIFAITNTSFDILVVGAKNGFMLRRTTFASCFEAAAMPVPPGAYR